MKFLKNYLLLNSLDVNYKNVKIYKLKNSNTTYQNIDNKGNIKNRISVDSEATTYDTKLILAIQKNDFELINLIIKHHSFDKNKSLLNISIFNAINNDELEIIKILIRCSNEIILLILIILVFFVMQFIRKIKNWFLLFL